MNILFDRSFYKSIKGISDIRIKRSARNATLSEPHLGQTLPKRSSGSL
jgi:hypothetical protein